ncbi:MAG: metallophosphoesterase [Alteromonadaceae bacterium]|nr:metallophosphoesterase [Alteromonadaceae bacterium]MAX42799.1 metallophosphoesterase [Alteromonadaceae bacterium]|tara:strand:- start:17309 stop:18019 length:711 start_codon:yes stop_codon:yes gene_type:complete
MNVKTTAISKAPLCKTLDIADEQRVFVVGDLDGDYQKLQAQLNKVSFNPQDDVLISLGDIIDRGQDSAELVEYFQEIGAHVVLGNHEHMMMEALMSRDSFAMRLWTQNGGAWHQSASVQTLLSLCRWFIKQPLAIKLNYQGHKIGISHTLPVTWSWENMPGNTEACVWPLLWDRERFLKRKHNVNHGVDFSVHGHNSTQVCLWIGNSYHIDTGRYGHPTVINLSDTIDAFKQLNIN